MLVWKEVKSAVGPGFTVGKSGRITVARVYRGVFPTKYEGPKWRVDMLVPGLKDQLPLHTKELAQANANRLASVWFDLAGAVPK